LKSTKNKNASYPFDWVFSSSEIVQHAIRDHFNLFLNRVNIFSLTNENAGHNYYHSRMFNHKNPLDSNKKYTYYKRCVDRLLKLLENKTPTLFICFVINEPEKRIAWAKGFDKHFKLPKNQTLDTFEEMIEYIYRINPNSKFLFINQFTEGDIKLDYEIVTPNIIWIDFTSKGGNSGLKYLDPFDNELMRVIFNGLATNHEKIY
jgi:hypothetical protein